MPPRAARAAMAPFEEQMKSALQNALSARTGGAVASEDIVIKPEDWETLLNKTAAMADAFSEQVGAQAGLRRRATVANAIQGFGKPSSNPTPTLQGGELDGDIDPDGAAQILDQEQSPGEREFSEQPQPPVSSAPETPSEQTESTEMDEDQGLKHCPYDGQILNPDGTCPAGDHSSLGAPPAQNGQTPPPIPPEARNGQTPPPIPPQARGRNTPPPIPPQARNPNTPPPISPAIIQASIQAEGNKKMADLNKKLEAAQKELADLKKDSKKTDTKSTWLRIAGGCSCITVILPAITSVFLFLNYQKKGKIEKEINRVEEQIANINKERTETAKKYKLKI